MSLATPRILRAFLDHNDYFAARAPECAIDLDANLTSAELDAEFCALASNYPLVLLDLLRTGVALDAIADRDLVLVVPPVA
jgi:hypothetical protein